MSKKSGGMFALLAGIAAGAAAVFLSERENRIKAKQELKAAARVATKLQKDFKANPKKAAAKLERKSEKVVKKVVAKSAAKVVKATKAKPKKATARKTSKRK